MFSESLIEPEIIQAYRETVYRVDGEQPFVLRIAECNKSLVNLYERGAEKSCAFITACNPYSQNLSDLTNTERQAALARELRRMGLTFFQSEGIHPAGKWPGEASYLVMGLSIEGAVCLGKTYEQNAIVWCGSDAIPQLILLR